MKLLSSLLIGVGVFFVTPTIAFAATNADVAQFTNQTLSILITIASLVSVLFLIRGGFQYITSTGKPEELDHAKKTIRNTLIGLVLIISAGVFSSILNTAFTTSATNTTTESFKLTPIQPATPSNGLTQVIIDAVGGFLQNIIQSATKPIVDGIIGFLTITPSFAANSVIFNFWLVMVGIVDALFALLIALLGFHIMSASTFGFDEIEFKHLLPRIGLAFLLANTSIFVIDWIISVCNLLILTVLKTTGGLDHAWVLNAIDPVKLFISPGGVGLINNIFMLLFIILATTLLLFYISRLITLAVGAVLSPFIFLLWLLPGFTDFAMISIRSYLVVLFTVFIHVVIIQLASAFLTLPEQTGTNPFISILVGIATLFTLLKVPSMILQFAFYSAANGAVRKLGGQIIHVVSSSVKSQSQDAEIVTRRKTVAL